MAKNINPKCKRCRRTNTKLMLKGDKCQSVKCPMNKRNYPPGFHGSKRRAKITDYGMQLNEKQKARLQYNLLEKQFKLTFNKAKAKEGNTGDNFLKLLEMRFDNVIFRSGLASSRPQARQLVNHGHFIVNDKRMDIPSYKVKPDDIIKIKANKKNKKFFNNINDSLKGKEFPGWLNIDNNKVEIKVLHQPDSASLKANFNMQMVVEYYSR